jgi:hypothetical protein
VTVSAGSQRELFRISEHEHGALLRLHTSGVYAIGVAADLLGFFESELEAEVEDTGWKRRGPKLAEPVLIQLEDLEIELSTDGSEVLIRRIAGSRDEFEDLCDLIVSHRLRE